MTRVYLESLGLEVDPDKRIVYLSDGGERELTRREYQAFKAQVRGATSISEIAAIMSAEDTASGLAPEGGMNTVDNNAATKHMATLRGKLGVGIIPLLKRGRKK